MEEENNKLEEEDEEVNEIDETFISCYSFTRNFLALEKASKILGFSFKMPFQGLSGRKSLFQGFPKLFAMTPLVINILFNLFYYFFF